MRIARLSVVSIALIASSSSVPVLAQSSAPVGTILVVHDYGRDIPSIEPFDRALIGAFGSSTPNSLDFDVEHLDLPRLSDDRDASLLAGYLRQKYDRAGLRAIVAVTDNALAFFRKYELFQDVATVAYTEGRPSGDVSVPEPHVVRVWAGPTAADTIQLALRLHPKTRQVVVLRAQTDSDGAREQEVRAELTAFQDRVVFTSLTVLSAEQAVAAVRGLPPDALVLLLPITTEETHRTASDDIALLSSAAPVPIYALRDTAIGSGAVGGYVSDTATAGAQAAALALRVAQGARPRDLPQERAPTVPMFDWRQLQRWRIREQDLPAGSQILFKERSAWDRYRWYIVGTVSLVGIQAAMVAGLVFLRSRQRRTERRNNDILRAVPDLMFLQSKDGVYLDYRAPDLGQLLVPPGEFLGRNMRDVLPPVLLRDIEPAFIQAVDTAGPVVVEYAIDMPQGTRQYEARLVRSNDQILTLVRDITTRKHAEAALREREQRYALATTAGAVGVWDRDLVTNELYVDATLKAILGFEDAEIPNRVEDWSARVHPEDTAAMTMAPTSIPGDTEKYETEHRMVHKDGSFRWFLSSGSVMRRADGRPYRIVGTSVDITERKHSADQFRLALETVTTGMLMVDRAGKIVLINAQIESLFGYRRQELINLPAELLVPGLLRDPQHGDRSSFHCDDNAFPSGGTRELFGLRKDGTEVPVRIGFNTLHMSEGEFVLCSIADMTERRQTDRERAAWTRRLQDLAGRLIEAQEGERARIARDLHDDVSQQLAALSIALSALERHVTTVPHGADLDADLSSLQQRARALTESVRVLSHDLHPDVLRHVGLAAALSTYCKELSSSQTLPVTCIAQGDFESINAEAALCLYRIAQEGLHNVVKHAHAHHVNVRLIRSGDSAELTIADDGKGFDFQKEESGAGLGLISISERVRLLGGTLSIVTALNKGTQLQVRVPIKARATTPGGRWEPSA